MSHNHPKIAIVIPAREKSTRFPGKPLALISGKPMIWHVWDKCIHAIDKSQVYIATDSSKIEKEVMEFGAQAIMTRESCLTGTDRVYEAALQIDADILINVQGDEPMLDPIDIKKVIEEAIKNPDTLINAMTEIQTEEEFFSTTVPKVVFDLDLNMLYMSRAGIPSNKQHKFVKGYKQVCIYAFPKDQLKVFYEYGKKTPFEQEEDIEILRFKELGYNIRMIKVSQSSIAVDTPEDLKRVNKIFELSNE